MRGNYFYNDKATGRTANVEAVLSEDGRTAEVRRMYSPDPLRGQGIQRGLMEQVCADADAEGVTLRTKITPVDGTDRDRLVAFFADLGFKANPADRAMMVRSPRH